MCGNSAQPIPSMIFAPVAARKSYRASCIRLVFIRARRSQSAGATRYVDSGPVFWI